MEKNLSAYLFVRQGKLQKSPAGERDLNRGELAAVKAFLKPAASPNCIRCCSVCSAGCAVFASFDGMTMRLNRQIVWKTFAHRRRLWLPLWRIVLTKARRKLNCGACFCRRNINGRLCFPAAAY